MLILKTLGLEPMHGCGIAVRLEQMSRGVLRLNAGSLFVPFQRLQVAGLVRSEWKATENSKRAKYYALTRPATNHGNDDYSLDGMSCRAKSTYDLRQAYLLFLTFIALFGTVLFHTLIVRDGMFSRMPPWRVHAH
jgi:hypothetical protein